MWRLNVFEAVERVINVRSSRRTFIESPFELLAKNLSENPKKSELLRLLLRTEADYQKLLTATPGVDAPIVNMLEDDLGRVVIQEFLTTRNLDIVNILTPKDSHHRPAIISRLCDRGSIDGIDLLLRSHMQLDILLTIKDGEYTLITSLLSNYAQASAARKDKTQTIAQFEKFFPLINNDNITQILLIIRDESKGKEVLKIISQSVPIIQLLVSKGLDMSRLMCYKAKDGTTSFEVASPEVRELAIKNSIRLEELAKATCEEWLKVRFYDANTLHNKANDFLKLFPEKEDLMRQHICSAILDLSNINQSIIGRTEILGFIDKFNKKSQVSTSLETLSAFIEEVKTLSAERLRERHWDKIVKLGDEGKFDLIATLTAEDEHSNSILSYASKSKDGCRIISYALAQGIDVTQIMTAKLKHQTVLAGASPEIKKLLLDNAQTKDTDKLGETFAQLFLKKDYFGRYTEIKDQIDEALNLLSQGKEQFLYAVNNAIISSFVKAGVKYGDPQEADIIKHIQKHLSNPKNLDSTTTAAAAAATADLEENEPSATPASASAGNVVRSNAHGAGISKGP